MSVVIIAYLFTCAVTAMIVANRKGNFWRMFVLAIFVSPVGVLVQEGTHEWWRLRAKNHTTHKESVEQPAAQTAE